MENLALASLFWSTVVMINQVYAFVVLCLVATANGFVVQTPAALSRGGHFVSRTATSQVVSVPSAAPGVQSLLVRAPRLAIKMGSDSTEKANAVSPAAAGGWTIAHGINAHKLMAAPVTAFLMWKYSCYTPAAWTYLVLHGGYGVLWVAKDITFPDRNFMERTSFGQVMTVFCSLNAVYFSIPWILVHFAKTVPVWYPAIAIAVYNVGMFLMMGSDCQKYYTLKANPGKLITNGFFKYVRSPNYLGEFLLYISFSMLTFSPWGFIPSAIFLLGGVAPNVQKKDRSMSRYPEFADYKARTYCVLPPFF